MYQVLGQPMRYLGKNDIQRFEIFYDGFTFARANPQEIDLVFKFENYIDKKYNASSRFQTLTTFYTEQADRAKAKQNKYDLLVPTDALALHMLKKDWEDFLRTVPQDQLPYEPYRAETNRQHRSIDDPWQDSTQARKEETTPQFELSLL
jgi:hypothetical protein